MSSRFVTATVTDVLATVLLSIRFGAQGGRGTRPDGQSEGNDHGGKNGGRAGQRGYPARRDLPVRGPRCGGSSAAEPLTDRPAAASADADGQPAAAVVAALNRTTSDTGELSRDEVLDNITLAMHG